MRKNTETQLRHNSETTDEIIGILTSISIVSKRLARNLMLLESRSAGNGGTSEQEKRRVSPDANKSRAI